VRFKNENFIYPRITDATVDAFAACGFNVRIRKYASCGPRLKQQQTFDTRAKREQLLKSK